MTQSPRSRQQRIEDTLLRLADDVDGWVATASADGVPYLIPLSYHWDGKTLLISTPASSPSSRNMTATGRVRVGIGPTRDLVLIEGTAQPLKDEEISAELGDAFGAPLRDRHLDRAHLQPPARRQRGLGRLTPVEFELAFAPPAAHAA